MRGEIQIEVRRNEDQSILGKSFRFKIPFFILSLVPLLVLVVVVGIVRFFQSLNDGTISIWRLVLLFAHVFGCVMVVAALYGRGRKGPRASVLPRGRC